MSKPNTNLILVLILLSVLAAGCRPVTPTPTPIPGVPKGWTLHENKEAGFALALPPGWTPADVSSGQMAIVAQALAKEYPGQFDPQWFGAGSDAVRLIAFDPSTQASKGVRATLSVAKSTEPQELTVQDVARMAVGALLAMNGEIDGQWTRITAEAGAMLELRARVTVHDAQGNPVTIGECVYAFAHGKDAYLLSMATLGDNFSAQIPINRDMARSFRLLE